MKRNLKFILRNINTKLRAEATKIYIKINNENNSLNIWLSKNKKFIFVSATLVITLLIFYILGYKSRESEIEKLLEENNKYKNEVIEVKTENDTLNQKLKFIYTSKDYLIYKIFKMSGIKIPETIPQEHLQTMYDEAIKNKIPIRIFFRVIYSESEFKSTAKSNRGAKGYMQLMPDTYNHYINKIKAKSSIPKNNIKIGALYLKDLYSFWDKRVKGEHKKWGLVLASYNAGIDRVIKNGIPDNGVTPQYVEFILD